MSTEPMGGLSFECQQGCTRCCEEPGWVYLTETDVARAAEFLGMTAQEFEARHIYRTRHLRRLRMLPGGRCPFLDGGCTIHPVKPVQCRLYPFWPEIVEKPGGWARTSRICPGIGQGPLIQIQEAREIAGEMKQAYSTMYG